MKKYIFAIIFLFITSVSFPDEILIPFSLYPQKVQEAFAVHGVKLDLDGNSRTPESWGFLINKGTEFVLYTYKPMKAEDWVLLNKIFYGTEDISGQVNSPSDN